MELSYNSFSGSIPSELGKLSKLVSMELHENSLSGSIPSELGLLSSITSILLSNNSLDGTIPSEIGQLSSLKNMKLSNNSLGGFIPSELGQLSSLENMELSYNSLYGSIPSEFGQLQSIMSMHFHYNNLSGSVPEEVCDVGETVLYSNNPSLIKCSLNSGDDAALIALKDTLTLTNSVNWSSIDYCEWTGVVCDSNKAYVKELSLKYRSLSGKSDLNYRILLVSSLIFLLFFE
jgi:hypothetical protein